MQTRKKSISLHALGVIPAVPRGSAHRSTSSSSNPSNATTNPSADAPPAKRLKRSHTLSSTSDSPASPTSPQRRRNVSASIDKQRPLPAPQTTPPPSPRHHPNGTLDYSGIGDDIVVGVLRQLEVTGNRPHQIKELATALTGSIRSVDRYVCQLFNHVIPLAPNHDIVAAPPIPSQSSLLASQTTCAGHGPRLPPAHWPRSRSMSILVACIISLRPLLVKKSQTTLMYL